MTTDQEHRDAAAAGGVQVWFSCPHCGGPASVGDDEVSRACPHCHSLLWLDRGGGDGDVGTVDCLVRGPDDLRDVVVERRLAEARARIVQGAGLRDPEGAPVEPAFLQQQLEHERRLLRERASIGRHALLWVPYLHVDGLAWAGCFGRRRGGAKRIELRSFLGEATEPAYDGGLVNVRDRGLRLSVARMRLLSEADVASGFHALAAVPTAELAERARASISARVLRPGLVDGIEQELVRFGGWVGRPPSLLFKPYWVAEVFGGARDEWLLVDGQTRLVAGELQGEAEAASLFAAPHGNPLASRRQVRARLLASRCVECGQDLAHDPRAWVRACATCLVGLGIGRDGLERLAYRWVEPPRGLGSPTWLPFWRLPFRVTSSSGRTVASLEDLATELGAGPGLAGDALLVPALPGLGTPPGERCFDQLAEWLARHPLETHPGPLPSGGRVVSAVVDADAAAALAPAFLAAAHDPRSVARLLPPAVRAWIADARVETGRAEPTWLPAAAGPQGFALMGDGPVVPPLLVEGGPTLDQQRRPLP